MRKEEVGQRGELERPSAVSPIKGGRRGTPLRIPRVPLLDLPGNNFLI